MLLTSLALGQQADPRASVSTALNQTAYLPGGTGAVAVVFDIKPGFHSQSSTPSQPSFIPFSIKMEEVAGITTLQPQYPEGHLETYPGLGALHVYTGKVVAFVPFQIAADAADGEITLKGRVRYQICDDTTCFPPRNATISVPVQVVTDPAKVQANQAELFADLKPIETAQTATAEPATPEQSDPEQSEPAAATTAPTATEGSADSAVTIAAQNTGLTTLSAFGMALFAGLIFNIMPCVLPVLPLKAIGFYEVSQHKRSRSILFGLVFSLGMIAVFALLGLLVLGLKLFTWGAMFSQAWFVWPLVIFLVAMSFGLFGAFTVNLPTGVYSFTPRHDTYSGNFFWGGLTAILATPCTAPALPVLLIWAAAQPAALGVFSMVLVGVGMALPYAILSAVPEIARKMPRTGPWPDLFKQMMGFAMLAVAVYFAAGRLVHGVDFWWWVVLVVAIACVYLVARTVQLTSNAAPVAVSSTISIVTLALSLAWTIRVTGILAPPAPVLVAAGADGGDPRLASGTFHDYSDELFAEARASGRPVLVKFTANWCATCQYIEGTVFRDAAVWSTLRDQQVIALKVDLTDEGAPGSDLLLQLNPAGGIPLTAIYAPGSNTPIQLASIYNSRQLMDTLASLDNGAPARVETAVGVLP